MLHHHLLHRQRMLLGNLRGVHWRRRHHGRRRRWPATPVWSRWRRGGVRIGRNGAERGKQARLCQRLPDLGLGHVSCLLLGVQIAHRLLIVERCNDCDGWGVLRRARLAYTVAPVALGGRTADTLRRD
eukprot:scaffold4535_cov138-Isochrysis_galbana.AAC.3